MAAKLKCGCENWPPEYVAEANEIESKELGGPGISAVR
jgi:hypothetical protein